MRTHRITGHGGVTLFVRDSGPEDAPPIILIHGWSQASLAWAKQAPLAEEFRLIAPDLRGHGLSDKPDAPEAYNTSQPWADDIAAIIATLALEKPALIGWSMGSWVVGDYLRCHGPQSLAGIGLVGGAVCSGAHRPASVTEKIRADVRALGSFEEDPERQINAIIDFLKACTNAPLSKRDLAFMTGFNMLCPPGVRKTCRLRSEDYRETYAGLSLPALIIHGAAEKVVPAGLLEQTQAVLPHATTHIYKGCGHAPFWEDAARFNADLKAFALSLFPKILPPEASQVETSARAGL